MRGSRHLCIHLVLQFHLHHTCPHQVQSSIHLGKVSITNMCNSKFFQAKIVNQAVELESIVRLCYYSVYDIIGMRFNGTEEEAE